MKTVEHKIPEDVKASVDETVALPPTSAKNLYVWSRCLTEMRKNSIASSHARICAGGKLSGYKGKMPGVLEEILIAIEKNKPVYLIGAFGGVVGEVCKVLHQENYPETLTEAWQITHNSGYTDLQLIARDRNMHADYEECVNILKAIGIERLASQSGLTVESYKRLMITPFIDECVHLVLIGLTALSRQTQKGIK
jgi:hypothetical protein